MMPAALLESTTSVRGERLPTPPGLAAAVHRFKRLDIEWQGRTETRLVWSRTCSGSATSTPTGPPQRSPPNPGTPPNTHHHSPRRPRLNAKPYGETEQTRHPQPPTQPRNDNRVTRSPRHNRITAKTTSEPQRQSAKSRQRAAESQRDLLPPKLVEHATISFRRPAASSVPCRHTENLVAFRWWRTPVNHAVGRYRSADPRLDDPDHFDDSVPLTDTGFHLVTDVHLRRRLDGCAIHRHMTALASRRGLRAGLVQAHRPCPSIDPGGLKHTLLLARSASHTPVAKNQPVTRASRRR